MNMYKCTYIYFYITNVVCYQLGAWSDQYFSISEIIPGEEQKVTKDQFINWHLKFSIIFNILYL